MDTFASQSTGLGKGHLIMHVRNGSGTAMTTADINALAAAFSVPAASHPLRYILPSFGNDSEFGFSTFTDLGGTGFQATSATGGLLGTASTSSLPWNTALCWSWQILSTWRGGKPRNYMMGVPAGAVQTGQQTAVSTAYATTLKAAVNNVLTAINAITLSGGSAQLGCVSYHTRNALRPTPVFFPYNGVTIHLRLDSQRRRLGKESTYGKV